MERETTPVVTNKLRVMEQVNKYRAEVIQFNEVPEELQKIIDARKLAKRFVSDIGFTHETYTSPLKVAVRSEYSKALIEWFDTHYGMQPDSVGPIFRAMDYVYTQRTGMYRVTYEGKRTEEALERYEESYGLDTNPEFQRGYVWTREQQIAYIEYLLSGGVSGREIYINCPGFLGVNTGTMVLVDGKQRLKAITDFFAGEFNVFDTAHHSDLTHEDASKIHWYCNINDITDPVDVVRWYLSMNNGGTAHTEEDLNVAREVLHSLKK